MDEVEKSLARPEEVLSVLTDFLREGLTPAMRLRAAELLGRHYGLFERRRQGSAVNPQAVRALEEAVRELRSS